MLAAGERQVADDVQAVPAAGGPAVDQHDHDLRHEADQPLHLEDVQAPARAAGSTVSAVSPVGVLVAVRPRMRWSPPEQNAQPPSFGDGPLPVSSTHADVGGHPRVVERAVQLVDGVRAGTRCGPRGGRTRRAPCPGRRARW